jgi:hypothetical protein
MGGIITFPSLLPSRLFNELATRNANEVPSKRTVDNALCPTATKKTRRFMETAKAHVPLHSPA